MSAANSQAVATTSSTNGDTISGGGFTWKSIAAVALVVGGILISLYLFKGKRKGAK